MAPRNEVYTLPTPCPTKLGPLVMVLCTAQRNEAPKLSKSQLHLVTPGPVNVKVLGPFLPVHPLTQGFLGQGRFNIPVYPLNVLLVVLLTARFRMATLPQELISTTREPFFDIKT